MAAGANETSAAANAAAAAPRGAGASGAGAAASAAAAAPRGAGANGAGAAASGAAAAPHGAGASGAGAAASPRGSAAGANPVNKPQLDSALHIEDVLARDGLWISTTAGTSMWPMLRNRRDTIVVRPATGRLRPLDVALYRRGGAYVLHRVITVEPDGYRILGDNCLEVEQVNNSQVIGVLDEFWRGDAHCDPHSRGWLAYARAWHAAYPVRRALKRARAAAGRLKRRVLAR